MVIFQTKCDFKNEWMSYTENSGLKTPLHLSIGTVIAKLRCGRVAKFMGQDSQTTFS